MRAMLVGTLILGLLVLVPGPVALASDHPLSFRGVCSFAVRDQGDPGSPPQGPVVPTTGPGTTTGPGRCTGTLVDSSGRSRRLSNEAVTFDARFLAVGTCTLATLTSSGRLRFRDGDLGFSLVEEFAGPGAVGRMTGNRGGTAVVTREFFGSQAVGQAQDCQRGQLTAADFLLQISTAGISG